MSLRDFYSHVSPEGVRLTGRLEAVNYSAEEAGENLAIGNDLPSDVVKAWMNSEPHRDNLLNPDFTEIGIARSNTNRWVAHIATPRDNAIAYCDAPLLIC